MEQFIPNKLLKAGDVVFSEGDFPEEGLYYICYGEVQVTRNEHGQPRELARLGQGDVFGEMGIINSSARNATVTATQDCGFFTLNQSNFQHRVNQLDPVLRGSFRVFVMTIRDLMTQRDMMAGQMQQMLQQMQQVPVAGAMPDVRAGEDASVTADANDGGGLVDGTPRKLSY
jgi:CRP-like cAMP-binding protein